MQWMSYTPGSARTPRRRRQSWPHYASLRQRAAYFAFDTAGNNPGCASYHSRAPARCHWRCLPSSSIPAPSKNLSLTLAYVDLGRIVPGVAPRRQTGYYFSAQAGF